MVNFKETFHFSRFERGFNIFQGVQLFPGFFPVLISSKHCYNGYIYGYSWKRVSIDGEFYSYYSIVEFIEDSY